MMPASMRILQEPLCQLTRGVTRWILEVKSYGIYPPSSNYLETWRHGFHSTLLSFRITTTDSRLGGSGTNTACCAALPFLQIPRYHFRRLAHSAVVYSSLQLNPWILRRGYREASRFHRISSPSHDITNTARMSWPVAAPDVLFQRNCLRGV
jgi:hypothetical protein